MVAPEAVANRVMHVDQCTSRRLVGQRQPGRELTRVPVSFGNVAKMFGSLIVSTRCTPASRTGPIAST